MSNIPTNIQHRLFNFDTYILVLIFTMPLVLVATNNWQVLPSISAYAVSGQPQILPIFLSILATMFAVKDALTNNKFNIFLAVCLIGIAAFNLEAYPTMHFASAGLFFIGTTFKMLYKTPNYLRLKMYAGAVIIIIGMLGHFMFSWYSLFWAECIAFAPAALYYMSKYFKKK